MKVQALSRSLDEIGTHYDVVVVGSGYGAGIAASRLARAGRRVCLLERGREILPGAYPNDLAGAQADMQVDGPRGTLGARDGLFDLRINDDQWALVGCGLGGTSLINANVALEMDPRLFDDPAWPAIFRDQPGLLEPFADQARRWLGVQPYPDDAPPLPKMQALQKAAQALRQPFRRTPIAVNFEDRINPSGVPQPKCNNCGDCTSGCNVGAKNTTLMNYLPDAQAHGAQLFTGARVTHVERDGAGEGARWRVHFECVPLRGQGAPLSPTGSVSADLVMLGAGALGSSEILLRSKARGLPLSERLGERFSGNGDVLAVGYDNCWQTTTDAQGQTQWSPIYGIGAGSNTLAPEQMPGPCITGVIDIRRMLDPREGLVIEEGVIPGALASLMPPMMLMASALVGGETAYGADQTRTRLEDLQTLGNAVQQDPGSLTALAYSGAVARTQTYLVMSVDEAAGRLQLVDDRLRIDWPGAGQSATIARDNQWLSDTSQAIQGVFVPNPLWSAALGHKIITVHPLGGCGMGDDAARGVTDTDGRVYAGAQGQAVHPGLFVCDGALLPAAAGVNPLLTISALAERICQRLCDAQGWPLDLTLAASRPLPPAGDDAPAPAGEGLLQRIEHAAQALVHEGSSLLSGALHALESGAIDLGRKLITEVIAKDPHLLSPSFEFTERMHGWVSLDAVQRRADGGGRLASDEALAAAWGRAAGQTMDFELTIRSEDLYQMVVDPTHAASITGQVRCAALCAQPMPVSSGVFHLLPPDMDRVETWTMTYEMVLARPGASRVRFKGHKVLHAEPGSSAWTDTTTLFVSVHDADSGDNRMLAQGVLTLTIEDLLWQMSTVKLEPPPGLLGELEGHWPAVRGAISKAYLAKFVGLFGTTLMRAYGGLLADLSNDPLQQLAALPRRALRLPPPEAHRVPVAPGAAVRLTRYRGGSRGPVVLAGGLAMRASTFASWTLPENLVEQLVARQYDVWLFDYRGCPDAEGTQAIFTIDDIARVDWPAAVDFVRRTTGAASVQAVAHCVGSMSLLMALLAGMQGVRSVVSSQLTLHPLTSWLNDAKADLGVARLLQQVQGMGGLFSCVPGTTDMDREIDVVAWGLPVPPGETCTSPVCKRVNAFYGSVLAHDRISEPAHLALAEQFGTVSMSPFGQLTQIMQRGRTVDAQGGNSYLTPAQAQRLALPIGFICGARNQIFFPETSLRTQRWLSTFNDPALYVRRVFDGYAHLDCFIGREAARDVWPFIFDELERGDAVAAAR